MPELPKGICPFCRLTRSLRADGTIRDHGEKGASLGCVGIGKNPYIPEQPNLPPMIRGLITPEQKYKLLADLDADIWLILQKRYDDNADVSMFKEPLEIIALCWDIREDLHWGISLVKAEEHAQKQDGIDSK